MNGTITAYLMNPAEDAVIFGTDLADGMWVLHEGRGARCSTAAPEDEQLRAQQFRQVTRLRLERNESFQGGLATIFVGEWADGYQETHRVTASATWIVKKASMPAGSGR